MHPPSLWLRAPLLAGAGLTLLAGMAGGLARLGWPLPAAPGQLAWHGGLMVAGFLGTLIGVERAIALDRRWPFAGPLLTSLGAVALLAGLPSALGQFLITLGSLLLVAVNAAIARRQVAAFTVTMGLGAGAWLVGNLLWLAGWPPLPVVLWWGGFLVLTIAGERLDLSRLRRPSTAGQALFMISIGLLLGGLGLTLASPDAGTRPTGAGLAALALWLTRYDIARRTVRQPGLPRYAALCLLTGYAWLGLAGGLALLHGAVTAGPAYDALLHSLFLGFVVSMLFGHAPIIVPVILGRPLVFRPTFYLPPALLHLSLALRVGADLAGWLAGRQWGGLLNALALLAFAAQLAIAIGRTGKRTPSPPAAERRRPDATKVTASATPRDYDSGGAPARRRPLRAKS